MANFGQVHVHIFCHWFLNRCLQKLNILHIFECIYYQERISNHVPIWFCLNSLNPPQGTSNDLDICDRYQCFLTSVLQWASMRILDRYWCSKATYCFLFHHISPLISVYVLAIPTQISSMSLPVASLICFP